MRRAAVILGGTLVVVVLGVAGTAAWLASRDPLASLPRVTAANRPAVVEEWREPWQGRTLLHVVLDDAAVGRIRFVVSLPDPLPRAPMPIVIVLGGLQGGSEGIREVTKLAGDPGPNAFVGYDWPLPSREPSIPEIVRRLPELRRSVLSVPGQVDAVLAWTSEQAWADPARASLLGFSLGAFVLPAAQRLAQERGAAIRWTIVAYAGAPIGAVIAGHPHAGPALLRPVLRAATNSLLRPVEPSFHLPHLRGRFLVLGATTDRLIARAAAERLEELTPEPRTIIHIEGDHMGLGPEKRKLLARVVYVSRTWLVEQGAIDPAAVRPSSAAGNAP